MSNGQIRITGDKMRNRASEFTTQANNLQSIITKMDGLLRVLQEEWEGDSSRAFAERFSQLRPGFVDAKKLIDEISKTLKVTAQKIEEVDATLASKIGK